MRPSWSLPALHSTSTGLSVASAHPPHCHLRAFAQTVHQDSSTPASCLPHSGPALLQCHFVSDVIVCHRLLHPIKRTPPLPLVPCFAPCPSVACRSPFSLSGHKLNEGSLLGPREEPPPPIRSSRLSAPLNLMVLCRGSRGLEATSARSPELQKPRLPLQFLSTCFSSWFSWSSCTSWRSSSFSCASRWISCRRPS